MAENAGQEAQITDDVSRGTLEGGEQPAATEQPNATGGGAARVDEDTLFAAKFKEKFGADYDADKIEALNIELNKKSAEIKKCAADIKKCSQDRKVVKK